MSEGLIIGCARRQRVIIDRRIAPIPLPIQLLSTFPNRMNDRGSRIRVQSAPNIRVVSCVCKNCNNKSYNGKSGEFCSIKCRRSHRVDGYDGKICICDATKRLPKGNCRNCGNNVLLRVDGFCCKKCKYKDY